MAMVSSPRTVTPLRPAISSVTTAMPRCRECRLRQFGFFDSMTDAELEFMQRFKNAHGRSWSGEYLLEQGSQKPRLLTLYSGWAIKTITLPSGESHLIKVLLPGDLIGLESVLSGAVRHAVQAVTDVTYCSLDCRQIDDMLNIPSLARRLTVMLLAEQQRIAERLAVVGACNARRNFAHFTLDLHQRLRERQMARDEGFRVPLTSVQLADALGLTTVHLNRVLRSFRQDGILTLENHVLTIQDMSALREVAALSGPSSESCPLL
ncbi:Crp/Fnr family transcriptional regulator [Blastochloris sulfoviridis]|nr:Crp/Fnr family transcriptional regulator [Blastochloris sulfoviridis]